MGGSLKQQQFERGNCERLASAIREFILVFSFLVISVISLVFIIGGFFVVFQPLSLGEEQIVCVSWCFLKASKDKPKDG